MASLAAGLCSGRSASRLSSVAGFPWRGVSYSFEGPLLSQVAGRTGMAEAAMAVAAVRAFGFVRTAVGAWSEPLMERPKLEAGMAGGGLTIGPMALSPIAAALAALGIMRRGTLGLEAHMRPLAISLFLFAASELLRLYATVTGTSLAAVTAAIATGGTVWWLRTVLLAAAAIVTLKWVTYYLFRQVFVQLFLAFQWTAISCFPHHGRVHRAASAGTVTAQTAEQMKIAAGVLSAVISARRDGLTAGYSRFQGSAGDRDGRRRPFADRHVYLASHLTAQGLSVLGLPIRWGISLPRANRSAASPSSI